MSFPPFPVPAFNTCIRAVAVAVFRGPAGHALTLCGEKHVKDSGAEKKREGSTTALPGSAPSTACGRARSAPLRAGAGREAAADKMAAPAGQSALRRLCGVALFVSQLYVLSGRGERGAPAGLGRAVGTGRAGLAEPQRGGCRSRGGRAGPELLAGLTSDERPGGGRRSGAPWRSPGGTVARARPRAAAPREEQLQCAVRTRREMSGEKTRLSWNISAGCLKGVNHFCSSLIFNVYILLFIQWETWLTFLLLLHFPCCCFFFSFNQCAEIKPFLVHFILKIPLSPFFFFPSHSRIFDGHEAFTATVHICKKPDFNKHRRSLLQGSRYSVAVPCVLALWVFSSKYWGYQ